MENEVRLDNRFLRKFGLIVAAAFLAAGAWATVFHGRHFPAWSMAAAAAFAAPALFAPRLLNWPCRGWLAVGRVLGRINTGVLLGFVFFALFSPTGIIARRFGYDPMRRRFDGSAETYRSPATARKADHMDLQY